MSKEELLRELNKTELVMANVRDFLKSLHKEDLLMNIYAHDPAGFLETAAEYLETNFAEMQAKLRMS